MTENDFLIKFRELMISKADLTKLLGANPVYSKISNPVPIYGRNVINLLDSYISGKINYHFVIEWCDVVRFSELFYYPNDEDEQEIVATVIDEIQDTEDETMTLPNSLIEKWRNLLNLRNSV